MFLNKLLNKFSELLSRPRARELADKAFSNVAIMANERLITLIKKRQLLHIY